MSEPWTEAEIADIRAELAGGYSAYDAAFARRWLATYDELRERLRAAEERIHLLSICCPHPEQGHTSECPTRLRERLREVERERDGWKGRWNVERENRELAEEAMQRHADLAAHNKRCAEQAEARVQELERHAACHDSVMGATAERQAHGETVQKLYAAEAKLKAAERRAELARAELGKVAEALLAQEEESEQLRERVRALGAALQEVLPIAERMQAACESGSTCYDNEYDYADARRYAAVIAEAKAALASAPPEPTP